MSSNDTHDIPIVIAGAGIGGLTAALALRQAGHNVVVIEKARELSEVGAGLQLSPNANAILDRFGLLDELEALGYAPPNLRIWSGRTGEQLGKVRLGPFIRKRHGLPFLVIHRADLQKTLLRRVQSTDGIDLQLSTEVVDVQPAPFDHLNCIFQNSEITGNLSCKALIGADGVWSKVRRLIPNHENAHFSGQVAYRTTIPIDKVPEQWRGDSGLWFHRDSHLVHYPIRAGRELNVVALSEEPWQDETWSAKADRESLVRQFRNWPAEVRNLIGLSETWLKWALCSVDASGPWAHGNVAIMGDAAHAMLPYMAQGAAMAIEDAAVLAAHLPIGTDNIPAALRAFERHRKPRVSYVQGIARRNARTFHFSDIPAVARDTVLRLSSPEKLTARFDRTYGWAPDDDFKTQA